MSISRALGRDHDDRHLAALAQLPAHVDAADPRQHHVEQHEVGLARCRSARAPRTRPSPPRRGSPRGAARSTAPRRSSPRPRPRAPSARSLRSIGLRCVVASGRRHRLASGMRSTNVEPSPSCDDTSTSPPWLVATWRTIASPRPVPPVSRLRACRRGRSARRSGRGRWAGMPMPWSATISSTHEPSTRTRTCTRRAGLAVLDGVLDQVAERRHELAAVAEHAHAGRQLEHRRSSMPRAPRRAGGPARPPRRRRRRRRRGRGRGSSPSSIRDSSSRSSIVRDDAVRLVDHPVGDAVDDAEVVLVGQRLGEHGQRADRRLQLVADVGDEVGAHGVDAAPLADVLDRRHRAAALERRGGDDDGDPRRAVQLERLAASPRRRAPWRAGRSTASSTSTPMCVPGQRARRPRLR